MGCCTGCDTGIGCEGGGGACATPQFPGLTFVTSAFPFQPATGALTPKPPAPKPGDYHADRGGVLAADHSRVDYVPPAAPPPTFITPPPPFWAVVNVAGLNGLRLRETPSMAGAVLGAAPNGARVWVRKANVAEVGAPAGAPMQWWEVALWTGDAPGVIGFMRAVGPHGEKNFTVPALPSTGFDASGDQNGEITMGCCGTKAQAAFAQASMTRMPDDASRLHQAQAEAMQAAAAFASTGAGPQPTGGAGGSVLLLDEYNAIIGNGPLSLAYAHPEQISLPALVSLADRLFRAGYTREAARTKDTYERLAFSRTSRGPMKAIGKRKHGVTANPFTPSRITRWRQGPTGPTGTGAVTALGKRRTFPLTNLYISPKIASELSRPMDANSPFSLNIPPGCEAAAQRLQAAYDQGAPRIVLDSLLKQYENCAAAVRGVSAGTGAVTALGKQRNSPIVLTIEPGDRPFSAPITHSHIFNAPLGCEAAAQRFNAAQAQGAPRIVLESLMKQYENCAAAVRGVSADRNTTGFPPGATLGRVVARIGLNVRTRPTPNAPLVTGLFNGTVFQMTDPLTVVGWADYIPEEGAADTNGKNRWAKVITASGQTGFLRAIGPAGEMNIQVTVQGGTGTGAIPAFLRPYVNSALASLASVLPGEMGRADQAPLAQTPYAIEHFASFAPTLHTIANELGAAHAALENAYRAQAAATTPGGATLPIDRNIPGLEKQLADILGTRLEMLLAAAQPGPMFAYPTPHTAARWLSDLLRKYSHEHAADVVDRVLYLASQQPNTGAVLALGKVKRNPAELAERFPDVLTSRPADSPSAQTSPTTERITQTHLMLQLFERYKSLMTLYMAGRDKPMASPYDAWPDLDTSVLTSLASQLDAFPNTQSEARKLREVAAYIQDVRTKLAAESEALRQYDVLANASPMSVTPDDLLRLAAELRFFGYVTPADYLTMRAELVRALYRYNEILPALRATMSALMEAMTRARGGSAREVLAGQIIAALQALDLVEVRDLANKLQSFQYQNEADELRQYAAAVLAALDER